MLTSNGGGHKGGIGDGDDNDNDDNNKNCDDQICVFFLKKILIFKINVKVF